MKTVLVILAGLAGVITGLLWFILGVWVALPGEISRQMADVQFALITVVLVGTAAALTGYFLAAGSRSWSAISGLVLVFLGLTVAIFTSLILRGQSFPGTGVVALNRLGTFLLLAAGPALLGNAAMAAGRLGRWRAAPAVALAAEELLFRGCVGVLLLTESMWIGLTVANELFLGVVVALLGLALLMPAGKSAA